MYMYMNGKYMKEFQKGNRLHVSKIYRVGVFGDLSIETVMNVLLLALGHHSAGSRSVTDQQNPHDQPQSRPDACKEKHSWKWERPCSHVLATSCHWPHFTSRTDPVHKSKNINGDQFMKYIVHEFQRARWKRTLLFLLRKSFGKKAFIWSQETHWKLAVKTSANCEANTVLWVNLSGRFERQTACFYAALTQLTNLPN